MTSPALTTAVRAIAEEALLTSRELVRAHAVQWTAPTVARPRDDTTERASGGHGDPTANTAMDPRRLAVRAAVIEAELALEGATAALTGARATLVAALHRFDDA